MRALNSDINVEKINNRTFRLLDTRTGFEIEVEDDAPLSDLLLNSDTNEFFKDIGFIGAGGSISKIREKQLPYRRRLQAEMRTEDLKQMYKFALSQVSFYQKNKSYLSISSHKYEAIFEKMPILTKSDVRKNFEKLLANNAGIAVGLKSNKYRVAQTSGSTGERLQVLSDMTLSRVPPNYRKLWELTTENGLPKTAVLTTPICNGAECHLGTATMDERTRDNALLFLNSSTDLFNIGDDEVRNVFEELNLFKPHFILCNPIYLHWFARKAEQLNIAFPKVELIWSSYQYLSIIQKKEIERLFQAPVYNSYTATELSGCDLTTECRFGQWHVREDQSFVEIERLPSRKDIGNILVTNHASRLMPLIRYRIGDQAKLTDVDCHCELSDWQTIEYHGRTKDRLFVENSWVSTREFDNVISTLAGIDFYTCLQASDGSVVVKVVTKQGRVLDKGKIIARISKHFKFKRLDIEQVQWLKPEASLKFRLTGSDMLSSEGQNNA